MSESLKFFVLTVRSENGKCWVYQSFGLIALKLGEQPNNKNFMILILENTKEYLAVHCVNIGTPPDLPSWLKKRQEQATIPILKGIANSTRIKVTI